MRRRRKRASQTRVWKWSSVSLGYQFSIGDRKSLILLVLLKELKEANVKLHLMSWPFNWALLAVTSNGCQRIDSGWSKKANSWTAADRISGLWWQYFKWWCIHTWLIDLFTSSQCLCLSRHTGWFLPIEPTYTLCLVSNVDFWSNASDGMIDFSLISTS